MIGSYSAEGKLLTIVRYTRPAGAALEAIAVKVLGVSLSDVDKASM